MATVQHRIFTSQRDIVACRNFCFSEAFSYFAYQNSTVNCLCGQEDTSLSCSDCTSDTISSTALNLCGNRYMRVPLALHMLSDIILTKSSPTTVYTPITITCTGYPSLISSFSWNLGDGAIINSTTGSIRHTYLYPGSFPVSLTMCGLGQCLTVEQLGNVSKKVDISANVSLAPLSEIRWSRTSSAGDKVYVGVCEGSWTHFQAMCIKVETNTKQNFQLASAACQNLGASLLTFSHLDQIEELLQSTYLPSEESFMGAEYDGSEYKWVATNAPATVLRALNLSQTTAPIQCPDGVLLGSSSHCFYTSSDKQTWVVAREQCNNQHAGDLAVLTDRNFGSLITSSLHLKTTSWIGLSAPKLLGHYIWVDGSAPTLDSSWNSNWQAIGVQWPCVALTPSGLWEATDCNQQLPYICEYTLNVVVQTDLYITGTIDVEKSTTSVQKLSERTALPPSSGLASVIFPGVWFARKGILYEVNLQLEAYKSDTALTIMVLRPSCPSGKFLIRPGCRSNVFASCGSPAEARNCPLLPTCSSSEVPCSLLNTCINSSVPCSCAGVTPVSADCSNTDLDDELSFSVVGQAVFDVPAAGGSVSAQFVNRLQLQPYDIIGFQSNGPSGFLSCTKDSSSNQQQIIFKKGSTSALRTAAEIKLGDYRKLEEQVCTVIAVYGIPAVLSIPDSIGFVPDADTYTFSAEVIASPALMASCSVTMDQEIGVVKWLHPALTQASPTPVLYVEAGVLETLLVIISSGSNLEVKWILSTGQSYSGNLTSSCPSALSALPQCQNPISQLTTPFAFLQLAFPLSQSTSLTVNVGNSLGQSVVIVSVNTIVRIKDLTLYHTSCVNHSACSPVLEAGLTHQFFCEFTAGFVDQYQFKVNGTQISASSLPNASYFFASPGLYVITVSASNGLETVKALLTVNVKVRAKVQQALLHELSPTYIRVGVDHSFRLTAEVQTNAELNITWQFGDGGYSSGTLQLSTTAANISQNYTYSQVGLYTLQVVLIDAFGVIVSLGTNVTVLTPIRRLVILIFICSSFWDPC
ncbi:hypothetical protein C0Q70_02036 [Pomacea canaliculata]|uniref:PKD domain-containing protein n=1 Tax=Pomacea canaliculata TaxID=400727 RepID=A0A2T7Q156_POMCA|nr:hypothetical protein C0Q70_02036 [Pomacea canaliculata]